MAEYHGPTLSPVLVIDLRSVFDSERWHKFSSRCERNRSVVPGRGNKESGAELPEKKQEGLLGRCQEALRHAMAVIHSSSERGYNAAVRPVNRGICSNRSGGGGRIE